MSRLSRIHGGTFFAFILILVATAATVGVVSSDNPRLSPWDEDAHIDYLVKVGRLSIPSAGDVMDEQALRIAACRGFYGPYQPAQPCDLPGPMDPAQYAFQGDSRAWTHPPLYYVVTRAAMVPLDIVLPGADFVTVGRIATALWTAVGLFLLFLVLRRLDVDPVIAWSIIALLLPSQPVLQRAEAISNDATGFFAGALLLALVVAGRGPLALGAASAAVMMMKAQNSIAVAAAIVACLLGLSALAANRQGAFFHDSRGRRIRQAAGLVAGVVAGYAIWRILQRLDAPSTTSGGDGGGAVSITAPALPPPREIVDLLFQNAQAFSTPMREFMSYLPTFTAAPYVGYVEFVVNLVFVGAAVAGILVLRRTHIGFPVAGAALTGVLIAPMVLTFAIGLSISVWALWPPRYGVGVVPFLALAVVLIPRYPVARVLVPVLAAATVAAFVAALVGV